VNLGVYFPTGGAFVLEKKASCLASLSVDLKLESHNYLVIFSTSSLTVFGSTLFDFSICIFAIFFGSGNLSKFDFF
jgi:hypothetical protein